MEYSRSEAPDELDREMALSQARTELSEVRTQLAVQRTVWSAEQTLNSWLRTALTAVAAGVAVYEFVSSSLTWLPKVIAVLLTLGGAGLYVFALWRYRQEQTRLKAAGADVTSLALIAALVLPLFIAALLAFALVTR